MKTIINQNGKAILHKNFLTKDDSVALFNTLKNTISWHQDQITLYGKKIPIPRLQAFYGENNIDYTYSKLTLTAIQFTPELVNLKNKIKEMTPNFIPNCVLLNYYRDGQDSMGWHSDDEPELGDTPTIASISLGGTRKFVLRNKQDNKLKHELHLEAGDLLLMLPPLQTHWEHAVPKTKKYNQPRINLTWREILDIR